MDWFSLLDSSPRALVSWSPEARALFTQITEEISGHPGVRVAPQLKRPAVMLGRRLAVAGHDDGIAVRLAGAAEQRALQIPGFRLLSRRDGMVVRGMVAVPWAAREHWRGLAHAAVNS
jgi:hypothetical protein